MDQEIGYPSATNDFWYQFMDSAKEVGGQMVTPRSAQTIASVYACTGAISESVAMLPAILYTEENDAKSRVKDSYLYKLLHDEPNPWMDSFQYFELMQCNILDYGNAYSHVQRAKSGKILRLTPLLPELVDVKMSTDGVLQYTYRGPQGTERYDQTELFHVKNRSRDGILGRSPIRVAADTVGFSLALQKYGNKLFENGAFLSGFIKAPFAFKDNEARERFMQSFRKYMGANNAGTTGLLEQGTDYAPFAQKAREAQFLEAKGFGVEEIARLYRVPPVMIQVMDKGMAFASVEQLAIMFVQYTVQPWVTRWEKAIKRQLLTEAGEENLFIKFNVSAFLRGDLKSRTESIVQQLQYGLLTINEGRNLLDQEKSEEPLADKIFISHNLIPAKDVNTDMNSNDQQSAEPQTPAPIDPAQVAKLAAEEVFKLIRAAENEGKIDEKQVKNDEKARFMPLLEGLLGRLRRRELEAVKQAAGKEGFYRWAEGFFDRHKELITETLSPACFVLRADYEPSLKVFVTEYTSFYQELFLSGPIEDCHSRLKADGTEWPQRLISILEREL